VTRGWAAYVFIAALILACDGADDRSRSRGMSRDAGVSTDTGLPCAWSPVDASAGRVVDTFSVNAMDTDPAIDQLVNHQHLIHEPQGDLDGREVVLLLAGAGSGTNGATRVLSAISGTGYRVVSLAFVNEFSVDHYCERMPILDADCYGDVLREMLYGDTDQTRLLRIGRENAVLNRISKLLLHLRRTRGAARWGDVVDEDGVVDWRRIAVVGGPRCGRLAAYLSRDVSLSRALLVARFGATLEGADEDQESGLAPWHAQARATPAERTYALWHSDSPSAPAAERVARAYGLDAFGDVVDIDIDPPPYGCGHLMRTGQRPSGTEQPGNRLDDSLVLDRYMPPADDGRSALISAYLYALRATQ